MPKQDRLPSTVGAWIALLLALLLTSACTAQPARTAAPTTRSRPTRMRAPRASRTRMTSPRPMRPRRQSAARTSANRPRGSRNPHRDKPPQPSPPPSPVLGPRTAPPAPAANVAPPPTATPPAAPLPDDVMPPAPNPAAAPAPTPAPPPEPSAPPPMPDLQSPGVCHKRHTLPSAAVYRSLMFLQRIQTVDLHPSLPGRSSIAKCFELLNHTNCSHASPDDGARGRSPAASNSILRFTETGKRNRHGAHGPIRC